jgi:hypothetical protein
LLASVVSELQPGAAAGVKKGPAGPVTTQMSHGRLFLVLKHLHEADLVARTLAREFAQAHPERLQNIAEELLSELGATGPAKRPGRDFKGEGYPPHGTGGCSEQPSRSITVQRSAEVARLPADIYLKLTPGRLAAAAPRTLRDPDALHRPIPDPGGDCGLPLAVVDWTAGCQLANRSGPVEPFATSHRYPAKTRQPVHGDATR